MAFPRRKCLRLGCIAVVLLLLPCPLASQPSGHEKKSGERTKETPAATPPKKAAALVAQRLTKSSVLSKEGGSKATEDAVALALGWLARHQDPAGGWGAAGFVNQCKKRCENKGGSGGDGTGSPEYDTGVTGLALLAFLGAGYTHTDPKNAAMAEIVRRASAYLLGGQVQSGETAGRIGKGGDQWVYDHAIATLALGELLMLSGDEAILKTPLTQAVKLCLKAQNPGSGWRYGVKPKDNDSSVTGWMVLALATARHAGLEIPKKDFDDSFKGALAWYGRVTAPNGKTGYFAPGDEGSHLMLFGNRYPFDKTRIQSMTAFSALSRLLAGTKRKDPLLTSSVRLLSDNPPQWKDHTGGQLSTINFYYWFHATNALFQVGGPGWKSWNKSMTEALVKTQRVDGDEKGSWDPIDDWGRVGGRVYSTALAALTLEVYYRYPRAKEGTGL